MNNPRTMRDWFLRGGERPSVKAEEPKASDPVVVCQNCGGDNLADEEQCTHCGAPLQGGTTTGEYCGGDDEERFDPAEYHDFLRRLVAPSDEPPANNGDGVGSKTCPECGHCWPSDTERCPMCHSTLSSPDQKTYLVKVSQVKKCLWEGYVEVVANSRLEALIKARDEFENCELDTWDLVDPELDSENDEEPVFSIEPET